MSKPNASLVRGYLTELERDPWDRKTLECVALWCHEAGFEEIALMLQALPTSEDELRKTGLPPDALRRLAGLRLLLGEDAWSERCFDRYDAACGSEPITISPGDAREIEMVPHMLMKLRRIVLASDLPDRIRVRSITAGISMLLSGFGPIPGEMLTLRAPEFFAMTIMPMQPIRICVENTSDQDIHNVLACALGDFPPPMATMAAPMLYGASLNAPIPSVEAGAHGELLDRAERLLMADPGPATDEARRALWDRVRALRGR